MATASLVQDVWLGFEPRLRARRLAPWRTPPVRVLFQLDRGESLDDPSVQVLLDTLAGRLEVIAWEPRATGPLPGVPGPELLQDTRRLAADGGRRFGDLAVLLAGRGLAAWVTLAAAHEPGLCGAIALAPSLAGAGPTTPEPSALRTALASALSAAPPEIPLLVAEGRERAATEARVVVEWLARAPRTAHLVVPGADDALSKAPWPATLAAWADGVGRASR